MPRLVTYQCPSCNKQFDFLHHPSDEPPPNRCTLCDAWVGDSPEPVPVLHLNMKTKHSKVPDKVYRDMETASTARASDAADMLGIDKSEMSSLKITNMQDNTREGDRNAITAAADQAMKELTVRGTGVGPSLQSGAAGWGTADVGSRADGAGSTRAFIQQGQQSRQFDQIASAVTAKGMMAKHVPTK